MTDKEIEAGIERACECDCAPPSTGWTVNPFPIIRDYIERLKHRAENAELRARLDKDGLPVKVGDTIYIEFLDGIKEWQVEKIELRKDEYIVYCGRADTDNYTFVTSRGYEMWWFTDPAKAEARQKELQGGEQK